MRIPANKLHPDRTVIILEIIRLESFRAAGEQTIYTKGGTGTTRLDCQITPAVSFPT